MTTTSQLTEKCAVAGVWGSAVAAEKTRDMLEALQHRGQDATGVVTLNGGMSRYVELGLVADAYPQAVLEELVGDIAIGHNRYATSSHAHDLEHVQPFADEDAQWALAHNGNLSVTKPLVEFLNEKNVAIDDLNDSGMMHAAIGWYLRAGSSMEDAVAKSYPLFVGAFSCVAICEGKLLAFRDGHGIRPLSYGKLPGGGYAVASETRALDALGAVEQADIGPGELLVVDENGARTVAIVEPTPKLDIFELVYFARGDSRLCGRVVEDIRRDFGAQLARECPVEGEAIVVPVPRSAVSAAEGYAQVSGHVYADGIERANRLRTFIRPDQESRKMAVRQKLIPKPEVLGGKRVVLIEDSIVRGTTLGVLVAMLREAGASEVHVRISSPPVLYPNFYGINMPSQSELIAHGRTVNDVCEKIGADSLGYLSVEGMLQATGQPADTFDTSVFTGEYPIDIGDHQNEITR
ncbi:MAG: amidophosphoribosyltransferase [Candidatus Saccharibacteria bacterium]|nr:MAG: amidophosphoribosyltransferase [Candidatus Saccharibacteria bacterium]